MPLGDIYLDPMTFPVGSGDDAALALVLQRLQHHLGARGVVDHARLGGHGTAQIGRQRRARRKAGEITWAQYMDKLEEAILLQSEVLDLKANPNRPGDGAVIEAKLDKGRGPVATVLVQRGILKVGDPFVAGNTMGKVRALMDERGNRLNAAAPGAPALVLGWDAVLEVVEYVLAGAAIVVPVWLILRLFNLRPAR